MERGSDKHGPRVDAEMEQATEGMERGAPVEPRAEEFREQESAGEGQPAPDTRPTPPDSLEARSDVARHLEPSRFPARKEELLAVAQEQEAPERIMGMLRRLPEDREFGTVEEVWEALGGESPDPPPS